MELSLDARPEVNRKLGNDLNNTLQQWGHAGATMGSHRCNNGVTQLQQWGHTVATMGSRRCDVIIKLLLFITSTKPPMGPSVYAISTKPPMGPSVYAISTKPPMVPSVYAISTKPPMGPSVYMLYLLSHHRDQA